MKRILSLAAMFAVLSYASPASAELKLSGEASVRFRDDFGNKSTYGAKTSTEDQYFQYRFRLKPSADLGDGYFFKALVQNENAAGGWQGLYANNTEQYNLQVSQFYFGHNSENSHWAVGRLPLGTLDNPILDLTLYAIPGAGPLSTAASSAGSSPTLYAVDTPISTNHFDRLFGFNYGVKLGDGELNAILVNFDNVSTTTADRGLFNDGYGFTAIYKTTVGDVTIAPQAYVTLTHLADNRSPYSLGAQAFIPAGKSKATLSGFYTADNNTYRGSNYDYSGYIFRVKGESGPVLAWIDYNKTTDNQNNKNYNNTFVWAQYKVNVHEAATGTFSLTPTVRYRASRENNSTGAIDNDLFRTELYATVTF
ncbi:MAG: hypothetical protein WCI81_05315 [Chlorobiaceae bacterium]